MLDEKFSYSPEQQKKIKDLREMVQGTPNLDVGLDDIFLSKFLACKNWDVEKALGGIYVYYNFKAANPLWMMHRPIEDFRELFFDIKTKFLMPRPDKYGRAVVVFKLVDAFKKYPNYLFDLIELDDMIYEALFLIPQVQECGITFICDMSGFNRNFLPILAPRIHRLINEKNKVLPFTKRTIHFLQSGIINNTLSSMLVPLMDKDFKANVQFHDMKKLYKFRDIIGFESVPAEYGGPAVNKININILWNHIEKNADYLYKLQSYKKLE